MPKVSEEHAAARREQILSAAQRCFARKGFHATSMNDVFAEAGLSAGAVYSYFRSKDEIIVAMAERAVRMIVPFFDAVLVEEPTPTLEDVTRRFVVELQELAAGPGSVAPQVWAEATHNPALVPVVTANLRRMRDFWTEIARREQAAGRLASDADVEAVGVVLFALTPGFIFGHLLLGDISPETVERGLRDLRRT
ncbi:TetR/AcrR family transcriptional regulator [Catenulispora rubra]|uniref:TetR/AcrR family transcriptional regulator n=1 Tax=Catenulispora rubra TaxID=280293 RepID=UPI001892562E|nr:TetR/AcrR family transcriptional regulator [Catenulispora rubra]